MLHDRSHWPTINLPGGNMPNYGSQQIGYTSNVISHLSQSQQQSYLQQQQQQQQRASANQSGAGPSPAKRLRQNPQSQSMRAPPSIAVTTIASEAIADDEEDNPKDLMDFLTPKDISITRFVQHHEWIEEVFNSPYSTGQIIPGELGIGRKGEIEALTRDFFNAPTEGRPTVPSESQPPRVGRLAPGKAEDFSKKVSEKLSELNSELEEMKRRHSQRMADAKEGGAILDSEKLLRSAPMSLASKADEWIFDGSSRGINLGDITTTGRRDTVDEIARKVEGLLGKKIVEVKELECIEQGGLEEKTETMRDDDLEYQLASPSANTNQLQDQSAPATAPQQDTPSVDPIGSVGHTPQPSTADVMTPGPDDEAAKTEVFPAEDITMEELPNMAGRKNSETGSWVMVNDETVSGDSHDQHMSSLDTFVDLPAASPMIEVSGDHADSPGDVLPSFTPNVPANATDEFGANDFGDFSNLDSAGEALSGYEGNASIGLDEHGDLGLDDSAFGDAFHATEASAGARPDMAES